ncbi:MAG: M48 family metalloprotease [Candidatus Omnitrophica bacterium]|nr:M48 family metalloprotease [Candidatus Omnitrophota bacterium]
MLCGLGLYGCITTEYNTATHQQDIFFYSTEKEVNLGRNVSKSVENKLPIFKDPRITNKIFEIGRMVSDVCDRKEINYYFGVIDEKDEINAASLPGGYIYVYRGLLDMLDNDDQIAFVLAHEIGHIVARHHIKKLQAALGYNFLLLAASQVPSSGNISGAQGVDLIFATIMSEYSQEDELLADELAVKYTEKAGFDPKEGINVLNKLREKNREEKPRPISYFRTHPYISQRIRSIKQLLGLPLEFQDIIND